MSFYQIPLFRRDCLCSFTLSDGYGDSTTFTQAPCTDVLDFLAIIQGKNTVPESNSMKKHESLAKEMKNPVISRYTIECGSTITSSTSSAFATIMRAPDYMINLIEREISCKGKEYNDEGRLVGGNKYSPDCMSQRHTRDYGHAHGD